MHILLIEDDRETAEFIRKGMLQSGQQIDLADNGNDGFELASSGSYDVLVIDRMLPGLDGLSIVRELRRLNILTPTLILSALGDVDHRVEGLQAGGDDYLVKPYAFTELLARLQALVRRGHPDQTKTVLHVRDLSMDLLKHKVTRANHEIELLPREFTLLKVLMQHANEVVTRTILLEKVWDYHFDPQTNIIDVHISRLRNKIDKGFDVPLLNTIRGVGYMLHDPEAT
jgi:two-component system OmpR family response regulator